ncbi:MAG: hypothetical protein WAM30_15525 [Candidatus Dormiibacterota bacterium]
MRTLATQMRLRRLMRLHAAELARLHGRPQDRTFARAEREVAVRRLLQAAGNVRSGWLAELTAGARPASSTQAPGAAVSPAVVRQVVRRLVAVEAAIAALLQPAVDLERGRVEFQDAAVPLLLMLRGLDGFEEAATFDALEAGGAALARSA